MTLFKTSPSAVSTSGNTKSGQRRKLGSISSDQPDLEQDADGMKLKGSLKDGRVSLRAELSKQTDCFAEFTCEIRGVDSQGKEVLSSARLLQPQDQYSPHPRDIGISPMAFPQLLSLVQDLDAKLAIVEKTTERLEDKMTSVEDSWEDKLDDLRKESQNTEEKLFEKLNILKNTLENKLTSVENSCEDKVDDIQKESNDMTSELNSTLLTNMESAVTDFFTIETCEKNAPIPLAPVFYPYPLFYPTDIPEIQSPLLCDMTTHNGGWIVIQRRHDGEVDFYRTWNNYKNGFGTFASDFWLGNEKIHAITSTGRYELRVDLKYNGQSKYARYDRFSIADESNNYKLTVGSYSGTAGDSLTHHNGYPFTTKDRDNDNIGPNCAVLYTGAWWYYSCHDSNLNGKWKAAHDSGLRWGTFTGNDSADFTEMKIRRLD